jgi:two-component system, LytTR family, response regulator
VIADDSPQAFPPTPPSTKIRTLIVDDEPLARSNLSVLLRRDPEIEIIGECGSGTEAVATVRSANPDLVFLDVQMPECDGFDVLELLGVGTSKKKNLPHAIIFVTAYDQYALRAFEAGALDYLLKPFDNARFDQALERAKQQIRRSQNRLPSEDQNSDGVSSRPRVAPDQPERIAIKSAGSVLFIKVSEIDWIEAADYYSCLHVGTKSHLLRRSMTELEQELSPSIFCRIHRSTIVNLERVQGLKLGEDGEYEVLLDGGAKLPLSRRHRKELQERMGLRDSQRR